MTVFGYEGSGVGGDMVKPLSLKFMIDMDIADEIPIGYQADTKEISRRYHPIDGMMLSSWLRRVKL